MTCLVKCCVYETRLSSPPRDKSVESKGELDLNRGLWWRDWGMGRRGLGVVGEGTRGGGEGKSTLQNGRRISHPSVVWSGMAEDGSTGGLGVTR